MDTPSFASLNPVFFLQTFVLELLHACEQQGRPSEHYIDTIAGSAGRFFEEAYRNDHAIRNTLDRETFADLIIGLKNHIGGNFSLDSSDEYAVRVVNTRCPFGDGVKNFPELCGMTSSVFGGIAARNFGYAKVHIKECIALDHGRCDVCVYTTRQAAKGKPGREYLNPEDASRERQAIDDLQSRIHKKLDGIWLQMSNAQPAPLRTKERPVIVAQSPSMRGVLKAIETVAPTGATVLIRGETGVGKELMARAIHAMSLRAKRPFVAINCGAIPETLIESALFGHEKGAFTGAVEVRHGVFERAEGGTLFLDEVDSLSAAAQTRLLRVLQEGELERVGGKQTLSVDVRIVAATNRDLERLMAEGQFRNDLYYRINVVRLYIPPLSDRQEDLPSLVQLILQRLKLKHGTQVEAVSREVMKQIKQYRWPGNVRELENVLERSVLFAEGAELTHLEMDSAGECEETRPTTWREIRKQAIEQAEVSFLNDMLGRTRGDVTRLAESMGLTPRAVYLKLQRYRINPARFRGK